MRRREADAGLDSILQTKFAHVTTHPKTVECSGSQDVCHVGEHYGNLFSY